MRCLVATASFNGKHGVCCCRFAVAVLSCVAHAVFPFSYDVWSIAAQVWYSSNDHRRLGRLLRSSHPVLDVLCGLPCCWASVSRYAIPNCFLVLLMCILSPYRMAARTEVTTARSIAKGLHRHVPASHVFVWASWRAAGAAWVCSVVLMMIMMYDWCFFCPFSVSVHHSLARCWHLHMHRWPVPGAWSSQWLIISSSSVLHNARSRHHWHLLFILVHPFHRHRHSSSRTPHAHPARSLHLSLLLSPSWFFPDRHHTCIVIIFVLWASPVIRWCSRCCWMTSIYWDNFR